MQTHNDLMYKYVRGSTLYNLSVPGKSDIDYGGVFACDQDELFGLRSRYVEQVSDEKHDITFFEFGRWFELLLKSNPTALESLYIPKEYIVGDIHPAVLNVIENRDMFLSQECFNSLFGYAKSQIQKARGLNKKIVKPMLERKRPIDCCYVQHNQGSIPFTKWLEMNNLKHEHCGLVNIPNMPNCFGVYYDYDATDEQCKYRGIMNEEGNSTSLRLSSVDKGETPLCVIYYNEDGYKTHCRQFKEYQDWVKNRNQSRYESNLDKNYDSKNMMHCFRLMNMGLEIAQGCGFNLVRTQDKDFLMDVRNHKYEYDELIDMLDDKVQLMNTAIETTTLPIKVNENDVNQLLIDCRHLIYG